MKISLNALKETAKSRPAGYYDDVVSRGIISGPYLEITPVEYKQLITKYAGQTNSTIRSSCCGRNENTPSGSFPPIYQQVKNLGGAMARVAGAAIYGQKIHATKEEIEKRQNICDSCEFYHKESKRCQKCGCYLRMKLQLETEHCPIQKW